MFSALLKPEQVRSVTGVFVQDMGQADWDKPRGHWFDAKAGFYVVGSKRRGSMGPTIASFAVRSTVAERSQPRCSHISMPIEYRFPGPSKSACSPCSLVGRSARVTALESEVTT